jgi:hypothetical protein
VCEEEGGALIKSGLMDCQLTQSFLISFLKIANMKAESALDSNGKQILMCLTPASMVATALVYGEGSLRIKKQ